MKNRKILNKLVSIAIIGYFFCGIIGCSSGASTSVKIGSELPAARVYFLDGEISSLSNFIGQDLILIFWASSCSHSYAALESVAEWQKGTKEGRRFQVLSVSVDKIDKESRVRQLVSSLGLNKVKHSFSGNDIYDEAYVALDVSELPTFVRIDRFGKVRAAGSKLSEVTKF